MSDTLEYIVNTLTDGDIPHKLILLMFLFLCTALLTIAIPIKLEITHKTR